MPIRWALNPVLTRWGFLLWTLPSGSRLDIIQKRATPYSVFIGKEHVCSNTAGTLKSNHSHGVFTHHVVFTSKLPSECIDPQVPICRQTGSGGNQITHDHILLEAP